LKLRFIRVGLALAGNALGLWIASLILDDMNISGVAFIVAVIIFTVLILVIEPLVSKVAEKSIEALQGGSALIATALSLLVTTWISDGLSIDGIGAWILATVIVWGASVIVGVLAAKLVIARMTPG